MPDDRSQPLSGPISDRIDKSDPNAINPERGQEPKSDTPHDGYPMGGRGTVSR